MGDLDEEFRETHLAILERFYQCFDSIYKYVKDLLLYFQEMNEGVFVQHTIEVCGTTHHLLDSSLFLFCLLHVCPRPHLLNVVCCVRQGVLLDPDGRQLLAEAVYLYGVMLLLLDLRIAGPTREALIISYYRYKACLRSSLLLLLLLFFSVLDWRGLLTPLLSWARLSFLSLDCLVMQCKYLRVVACCCCCCCCVQGSSTIANIDEVCRLCAATGFDPRSGKKPNNYPVEYFARFPLPQDILVMIVGRLRADDIYEQTLHYPSSVPLSSPPLPFSLMSLYDGCVCRPSHRSAALSTQASMLYVILYFVPNILIKEQARTLASAAFLRRFVLCCVLYSTSSFPV